ncbi:hypothetical protein AB6A40_001051 [Gnathostoma spinigerum]|uniref:Cysteine/serine-rich nuclear protein N-terminal domain-containing protein n=1 Tax=Gnathostoma spinigerum TaxID=75299 RepID=A0ABD6ECC6_9BILA
MEGKHHSSKSFGLNEFESISRLQHLDRHRRLSSERARERLNLKHHFLSENVSGQAKTFLKDEYLKKPVIDECALSGKMEERSVRKDDVIFERSKEISKSCADAIMALDEFEDLCDDFDDCEESEHEEGLGVLDNDDFNEVNEAHATRFDHQTIDARERRNMLKSAGVKVDKSEAAICRKIRESRLKCGCECTNGVCMPSTCRCSIDGVECLVDNPPFPCSCKASTCNNPAGRVEFDVARVRAHFISTMMRLRALDKMNFAAEEVCSPTHTRFFDECYAGKNEASCSTSLAKNECHSTSSSSPQSSSVWPDRTKKESSGSPSENDTNACSFTEKNSGSNYEEACSKHANESSALFDQVDEQFQTPPAKLRQIYPVTPVYKTFSSVVTETEHSY